MLRRSTNKPNGKKSNKDIAVPGISRVLVVFATSTRKYQELRRRLLSAIFIKVNDKYLNGEGKTSTHSTDYLLSGKIISYFIMQIILDDTFYIMAALREKYFCDSREGIHVI